jgi:hypothetical protein
MRSKARVEGEDFVLRKEDIGLPITRQIKEAKVRISPINFWDRFKISKWEPDRMAILPDSTRKSLI